MDILFKAAQFYKDNSRDIDRALFEFHFADFPLDELLKVLSAYQNEDGGFGHGLEVDISAPESNPFATELALLICIQVGVTPEHPLIRKTVDYLENTQEDDGDWSFSPAIYEHELAPWFQGWERPNLNPACTLCGLLKELGLGSEQLHQKVERMFQQLAVPDDLASDEYYSVRPYAYYYLPDWEHPQREFYLSGVLWWLIRVHVNGKIADSGHFFDYVRAPYTYTGVHLPEAILSERLDMLISEQADDGGWPTPYNPMWRGWFTIQNLLVLKAFGRI